MCDILKFGDHIEIRPKGISLFCKDDSTFHVQNIV